MSIRVQDSSPVQTVAEKRNNAKNEQMCCKKEESRDLQKQIISFQGSQALKVKAMVSPNIAFASNHKGFHEEEFHSVVPDLFKLKSEELIIPARKDAGVSRTKIIKNKTDGNETVKVNNASGQEVINVSKSKEYKAEVEFLTGKSGNFTRIHVPKELTGTDRNIVIIPLPESNLDNSKFRIDTSVKQSSVAFQGNKQPDIFCFPVYKPDEVAARTLKFSEQWKPHEKENTNQGEKTVVELLNGGVGSRFRPLGLTPKPIIPTPGGQPLQNYALGMLTEQGIVKNNPVIKPLPADSQNYGNAGTISKVMKNIEVDGLSLLIPADGINDLDIDKAIEFHKSKGDAAVTVVSAKLPAEETVKNFGVAKVDPNDRSKVLEFKEKPQTLEEAKSLTVDGKNCLASTMIVILSKEAREFRDELYKEKFESHGKSYDFSGDFLETLNKECQNDRLTDSNGKPLKIYAYAAKGDWRDLGNANDFHQGFVEIAKGEKCKGLPEELKSEIKNNVIIKPEAEIVCAAGTREAFEKFLGEGSIKGKFIVMPQGT